MWIEDMDSVTEFFRGNFPYYLFIILPIFMLMTPMSSVSASHEFPVHRMQHFDLHGAAHGCRSASVNLEARSLGSWSTFRHCVVTRLQDLTVDHFREIRSKAGALLIMLPKDLTGLTQEEKQQLMILEDAMLAQDISSPVYFAKYTKELDDIVSDISSGFITDEKAGTALEAIVNSVSANGYQIVINPGATTPKNDMSLITLQGKLTGTGSEGKIPTIAIVAHYDSFGVAPELSFGADSNGSGVAILLEIARLFSHLYSSVKTQGKYNLVFLLTSGGKINYQGSKKWLEEELDSLDGSIIQDASFVVCLDTLASGDAMYMHVSKPPKEGSPAAQFIKELKSAADKYPQVTIDGVHKKINLADDMLAWEHERYSIRRLPAFTVSSLKSHRDSSRATILDVKENVQLDRLVRNTHIVAEALGKFVYNYTADNLFSGPLTVESESLESILNFVGSQPRSPQIIAQKHNTLVPTLKTLLSKYCKDVKLTTFTPDKRDPEFLFYDITGANVNVYNVKPAIFDLVLTIGIVIYLTGVYFVIQYFPKAYSFAISMSVKNKKAN